MLTDLNASDVSFVRIGDSLLIKVTETGKTVTVESFFTNNGIDVLRFADGTEWNRTQSAQDVRPAPDRVVVRDACILPNSDRSWLS